jgi:exodeoxyribonuclease VII small subunit
MDQMDILGTTPEQSSSPPRSPCGGDHAGPAPPAAGPTFEAALTEIQQVLESLEDGSVGLEESLQRFERGTALLRHCYALLESAERRIEILTGRDDNGNHTSAPFDSEATHQPEQPKAGRRRRRTAPEPPPVDAPPEAGVRLF